MRLFYKLFSVASVLVCAALIAPSSAQVAGQLPRDATQPRMNLPQVDRPQLNLPPFFGAGTDAAQSWLTPMLIARTQAGDPPRPMDPSIAERFENAPFIPPLPSNNDRGAPPPQPYPRIPDLGGWNLPRPGASAPPPTYSGPSPLTGSITVININRFETVNVWTKCFTHDGVNIPSLSREDSVRPLGMLNYEPVIYLGETGEGEGRVGGVAPFWCVIAASAPVTAHARTVNYDYVDFFVAAR